MSKSWGLKWVSVCQGFQSGLTWGLLLLQSVIWRLTWGCRSLFRTDSSLACCQQLLLLALGRRLQFLSTPHPQASPASAAGCMLSRAPAPPDRGQGGSKPQAWGLLGGEHPHFHSALSLPCRSARPGHTNGRGLAPPFKECQRILCTHFKTPHEFIWLGTGTNVWT